jgi:uncharacterized protein
MTAKNTAMLEVVFNRNPWPVSAQVTTCDIFCIYKVRYEWDERKNRQNQRKHDGISFELAALVFEDEHCLIGFDRADETGELRWHALGAVSVEPEFAAVLLVVHAYREDSNGEEIIRIISARRAEANELRRYQEQSVD